jgi:hypothetical protein
MEQPCPNRLRKGRGVVNQSTSRQAMPAALVMQGLLDVGRMGCEEQPIQQTSTNQKTLYATVTSHYCTHNIKAYIKLFHS